MSSKDREISDLAQQFGMSRDEVRQYIAASMAIFDQDAEAIPASHRVRTVEPDSSFIATRRQRRHEWGSHYE